MKLPMNCPFCGLGQEGALTEDEKIVFAKSVVFHDGIPLDLKEHDLLRVHPENTEYAYKCLECGAHGPMGGTKEEAVDVWNKRCSK